MTLLTGRAIDWAAAVWDSDSRFKYSVDYFIQQLREVFEYPAGGRDISTQIINITQGNRTAAEYTVEFRTLAAQSGWNDVALKAMFHRSLSTELQTELACKGEDSSFSEFVSLAIKIDNLMRQAPKCKGSGGNPHDEPMQLNISRFSEVDRERRRQHQLCFYCGEAGHRSLGCQHKSQAAPRVNIEHFSLLSNKSFTLAIALKTDTLSLELTAMIDSGAALNLINKDIVSKYNIPTQPFAPLSKSRPSMMHSLVRGSLIKQKLSSSMSVCYIRNPSHCTSLTLLNTRSSWDILGYPFTTLTFPGIMVS